MLPLIAGFFLALAAGWYLKQLSVPKGPVLDKSEWRTFKLIRKIQVNHNSARYKFELPREDATLGLPIGQHISVMVEIDGKEVSRSYTPISLDDDKGYFELLIKSYPNGVLSKHFDSLKIGDSIKVRGPKGNFKYVPNTIRHIGMIAGGSGLTPMYQIILSILRNSNDKTKLDLIYANVNEEDILLRSELDRLAKLHSNFNVYYVLNNPPEDWEGGDGFVSEDMIAEHMPMPAPDIKVLICGPPPMVKAMESHLVNLGYDKPRVVSKAEDQVFKF